MFCNDSDVSDASDAKRQSYSKRLFVGGLTMNNVAAECLNSITLSIAKALDGGISEHAKEALRKILRLTIDERKRLYEGVISGGSANER